jgi:uncharacterized protein (DUF1501 family)
MGKPTMKRRHFLQFAAAAASTGLTLGLPKRSLNAQAEAFAGPFWVQVNAGGAWDPTLLFNPVADLLQSRKYTEIGTAGNISYANVPLDPMELGLDPTKGYEASLMSNAAFVAKYGAALTVINGIDTSTNNHDAGSRTMWSGRLAEGYPSVGALVAAAKGNGSPMAYLSAGGYDATAALVPLTRVSGADAMKKLALVGKVDPNNAMSMDAYHSAGTINRIRAAQSARLQALHDEQYLPRLQGSMNELIAARARDGELSTLQIPEKLVEVPGFGDLQRMMQQAQLAVAAFKAGVAVSANLNLGGFDTHANHDRNQPLQLSKLLFGIDYLMTLAQTELGGNLVMVAASDFGRGPFYNGDGAGAGKDHWPVTSVFAMGPGIAGNRVIGGTTADQRARLVDPGSLAVVDGVDGTDGVKIRPEHVHRALRKLAGVDESLFPLPGDALALFG